MMSDFSWLATEAKQIHGVFQGMFYSMIGCFLLIGVVLEYFKFSIGGMPSFMTLVGRALTATLLLVAFPEILNILASFTDSLATEIGSLNKFELVLSRMGSQLDKLSWSWTSVKSMVLVTLSFLTFFLLYISVYLTDAMYIFTWTLLYIFSPLLIAFYVLPTTSGLTRNLFKSLVVVATWKVVWCVLAAILWSSALSDLDKLANEANFFTICLFNIMLAVSLLFSPFVVSSFLSQGLESASTRAGAVAVAAMSGGTKYAAKVAKDKFFPTRNENAKRMSGFNSARPHNRGQNKPNVSRRT